MSSIHFDIYARNEFRAFVYLSKMGPFIPALDETSWCEAAQKSNGVELCVIFNWNGKPNMDDGGK